MNVKRCPYCKDGIRTGLPGNACENCMNTGEIPDIFSVTKEQRDSWRHQSALYDETMKDG